MPNPNDEFEDTPALDVIEEDGDAAVEYPADTEPPPPAPESELIKVVEERTSEQLSVDAFVEKVMAERNAPEVVVTPPPMTERQLSAREQELAAGRARVKHFEAQKKLAQPHVKDTSEGHSTPVFVPKTTAGKDAKFGGGTAVG